MINVDDIRRLRHGFRVIARSEATKPACRQAGNLPTLRLLPRPAASAAKRRGGRSTSFRSQ